MIIHPRYSYKTILTPLCTPAELDQPIGTMGFIGAVTHNEGVNVRSVGTILLAQGVIKHAVGVELKFTTEFEVDCYGSLSSLQGSSGDKFRHQLGYLTVVILVFSVQRHIFI